MAHTAFATTTRGLRRNSPPMRLFEKAKRLGIWNPSNLDLSRDAQSRICSCVSLPSFRLVRRQ
jgi:hypothetical protein